MPPPSPFAPLATASVSTSKTCGREAEGTNGDHGQVLSDSRPQTAPALRAQARGVTTPLPTSSRKVLVAASVASPECIRGIARHARAHDWHLVTDMLFTGALPRGWNGSGILALAPHPPELLAHLQGTGLPCVVLTDGDVAVDLPRVEPDHRAIGRLAADHFLERAHRHFAWAPFLNDAANRERLAGFQERLAEHGRTCRILPPAHTRIGPYWQDNWEEYRRHLAAELLRLPRPTAIFAFNDCTAANLVDAARDAGLTVPDDIAVLGVGNSAVCELSSVPLSSVDEDMPELGYRAAVMLENLLSGTRTLATSMRVPPRGVITRLSSDMAAVTDPRVARALHYIAEHYSDPMLTVCQVADALGMSRRNLERSFREETGCTIYDNIIAVRMREASRLLRTHPKVKTSDVAGWVGIGGVGTFFRTFRRYFGMSPQAHRAWLLRTSPEPQTPAKRPPSSAAPAIRGPAVRIKISAA